MLNLGLFVQAFIQAFNAACKSNGAAKVLIPPGTYMSGEVFFQGPCTAPAPITVEVQGTVLAQTDLSEYVNGQWFAIQNIDGLVLEGGGTFDGRGNESWRYNDCGGQAACNSLLPPVSTQIRPFCFPLSMFLETRTMKIFETMYKLCENSFKKFKTSFFFS